MRLFVTPTEGNYYLHLYYKDENVRLRVLVGETEIIAQDTGTGQIGHLATQIGGYHSWIDIKGSGQIFAAVISMVPEVDPEFVRTLTPDDLTRVDDAGRILLLDDVLTG